MASVGSIVGGAFALVRDRPGSVVAWGVTYILGNLAIIFIAGLLAAGSMGFGATGDLPSLSGGFLVTMLLVYLGYFLLFAVLLNAVFRAVLRPDDRGFFSLRLGMDEFRMLGLLLLVLIASFVIMFIVQLLMTMVLSFLMLALGGGVMGGVVTVVVSLLYFGAIIWVGVRLSLLYPLTFYRRAITIDGTWALTRGRFWTLFLSYLVVAVVFGVVFFALAWFTFGGMFATAAQSSQGVGPEEAGARAMMMFAMQFSAIPLGVKIGVGLLWGVLLAIVSTVFNAMLAVATRELLIDSGETPEDEAYRSAEIFE